jgi:hypothetical protein
VIKNVRRQRTNSKVKEKIGALIKDGKPRNDDEVNEIFFPYYEPDPEASKYRDFICWRNGILASFKDEEGVRSCLNFKKVTKKKGKVTKRESKWVDIDTTKDLSALKEIEKSLIRKIDGITNTQKKVNKRYQTVHKDQQRFNFDNGKIESGE